MQKETIVRVANEHTNTAQMLLEALQELGMTATAGTVPSCDGQLHGFEIEGQERVPGNNDGYFFIDSDAGVSVAGDVKSGSRIIILPGEELSSESLATIFEKANNVMATVAKTAKETAPLLKEYWNSLDEADMDDIYFVKRGLHCVVGAKKTDDAVVVAYLNLCGAIEYLVAYTPDGTRNVLKGVASEGCFAKVGREHAEFVTIGFDSAATIYQATGRSSIAVETPSGLYKMLERDPKLTIVIPAVQELIDVATECKEKFGCTVITIPSLKAKTPTLNEYMLSGGNVAEALHVKARSRQFLTISEILGINMSSSWTIRGLIPSGASLSMVYGPSGKGKTYVMIDMSLSIACGLPNWFGQKVHKGKVLYLLGEGISAVRERIQIWMQEHNVQVEDFENNFVMTTVNFPIDSEEKLSRMRTQMNKELTGFKPDVIIVDTLNLFMSGDENSTKDANSFIFALKNLSRDYNCAIVLVHHTGVSTESRNRGSSVFFGALDSCISVTRDENNSEVIAVSQTKNRGLLELPSVYLKMDMHEIAGTVDEDTGEPKSNAILVIADPPKKTQAKTKDYLFLAEDCKREFISKDGLVCISKSSLEECYRKKNPSKSSSDIKREFNPNQSRTLSRLIKHGLLKETDSSDEVYAIDDEELLAEIAFHSSEIEPEIDDYESDFEDDPDVDDELLYNEESQP